MHDYRQAAKNNLPPPTKSELTSGLASTVGAAAAQVEDNEGKQALARHRSIVALNGALSSSLAIRVSAAGLHLKLAEMMVQMLVRQE